MLAREVTRLTRVTRVLTRVVTRLTRVTRG